MARTASKTDLFENYPVPKAVAVLALPNIAACLVMVLYNLADTFFVGMLNDANETSAVTLAAPVLLAFNAVNNLFGVGCSSVMSRALGVKDYDTVRKSSAFGCYCAVISGLLFSLFATVFKGGLLNILGASSENISQTAGYMFWTVTCGAVPSILNVVMGSMVRAEGSSVHASIGTMSGCLLNIILDPLFILPQFLGMGAAGAGLATFISNTVACLYFIVFIIVKKEKTFVSIKPTDFRPTKPLVKDVMNVGIPSAIQNLLNVTGMTVLNNFTAAFGSEAVSAMGISHKTSMIPMYIAMGFGQGIMPLIGYNFASGNRKRVKKTLDFSLLIDIIFMTAAAAVFCVFSRGIIKMFMKEEAIIEYGSKFLVGNSLAQPFLCIDFLAVGVFQACGMGKRSFIFAVLRKIALEIPALFILNKLFPLYGLAYAQLVAEFVLAVAAIVLLIRIPKEIQQKNEPASA